MSEKQRGFTLIEMSIVLVLIGLIIGGVLKGQKMLQSTRLKMTVSQWDGVKFGMTSFKDKYGQLPGDLNDARNMIDTGLVDGDGDGIIGYRSLSGSRDYAYVWDHLTAAEMLGGINVQTGDVPRLPARVDGAEFFLAFDDSGSGHDGGQNNNKHYLNLVRRTSSDPTQWNISLHSQTGDCLTGEEAWEIDRKYDDNESTTGAIRFYFDSSATAEEESPRGTATKAAMMFEVD